jgi:Flp pilus assembly protein TadG
MAFAAPVLFIIALGLFEVAHAFSVQHLIQDAARQGCRAAVCPHSSNARVNRLVDDLLRGEGVTRAKTVILVNQAPGEIAQARSTDQITVNVSIAAPDVSIVPGLKYLTGTLRGSFTLRLQ